MKGYNKRMDKRLLTILRCPVTRKGLSVLPKDKLARVNAAIGEGSLVFQSTDLQLVTHWIGSNTKFTVPPPSGIVT